MKKIIFLLSLLVPPFASAELSPDAKIWQTLYRGKAVAPAGQTWRHTVELNFERTQGGWGGCTGVFVAEDTILTAAHCRIRNGGTVQINLFQENSTEPTPIWVSGDEFSFRAHPRYRKTTYTAGSDDVAVLVLRDERLPEGFVPATFLDSRLNYALRPGNTVSVIGAGNTEKGVGSDRLYFVGGSILNYEADDIMRIRVTPGQGVCGGDSGGPIFVRHTDGKLYLTALTTAVEITIRGDCGTALYANFISDDRYRWVMGTTGDLRLKFQKERGRNPRRPMSNQEGSTREI